VPPEAEGAEGPSGAPQPLVLRWLKALGAFWWDFLVSDTPEFLIGVLVAVAVVALMVRAGQINTVAVVGFPVMVIVLLGLSVVRARPRRPR
jgi:hypothetical protein